MVDTIRTMAALQSLWADNTTADISPQDGRDVIVSSMTGGYGLIYVTGGSTEQTSIGTTDVLLTAFTSDSGADSGCTETAASDRITLDRAGKWLVLFQCDILPSAASEVLTFTIRYDGSLTNYKGQVRTLDTTYHRVAIFAIVASTGANEGVEVYVKSGNGSGTGITVAEAQLAVVRIGE